MKFGFDLGYTTTGVDAKSNVVNDVDIINMTNNIPLIFLIDAFLFLSEMDDMSSPFRTSLRNK